MSTSWAFIADGAVRFLISGRLMPLPAHKRLERSWELSSLSAQERSDALLEKASIIVRPPFLTGSGSFMILGSWACVHVKADKTNNVVKKIPLKNDVFIIPSFSVR